MKFWPLFFLFSQAVLALEPNSKCGDENELITRDEVPCLVQELIETRFPTIASAYAAGRIRLTEFHSSAYFLKTTFIRGYLSEIKSNRYYSIDVNPVIYKAGPSMMAIQGILAHELFHLVDYEQDRVRAIINIGLSEVFMPSIYERFTDERAMEIGFAKGIKAYRVWEYTQLNARQLRIKERVYDTPEEINDWMKMHKN